MCPPAVCSSSPPAAATRYNQDKVFQAISTRNLTIIGPYNLTQGAGAPATLSARVTQMRRHGHRAARLYWCREPNLQS
jgi:hypothetical protein